jgi:hypothetical protein
LHDVHCPVYENPTSVRVAYHVAEEIAHFIYFRVTAEQRHHDGVLVSCRLEIDDVVVEIVLEGAGRDGKELSTRGVYENGPKRTYL